MHDPQPSTAQRVPAPHRSAFLDAVLARLRHDRGAALVEFAMLLPVLLAVLVGILSFGRAMNYDEQATHMANEAARYAMVNQVPSGATGTLGQWVRGQVQGDSPELANSTGSVSGTQVCVSYGSGGTGVGQPVTVTMKFTFSWLPVLKVKTLSTTITRTATMRIEVPPTGAFFASGCS